MSHVDLPWQAHEAAIRGRDDELLLRRAWLEAPGRLAAWMAYCRPDQKAEYAWPAGTPRRDVLAGFSAFDQPRPRAAQWTLFEACRSAGKTVMARDFALRGMLSGRVRGVLAVAERAPDATAFVAALKATQMPEYRKSERPDDDTVRRYHATPLGATYPLARWSGGDTEWHLSRDGDGRTDAVVWTRGIDGHLKGFNEQGIRPDLVIPDDVQTSRSAYSATVTKSVLAALLGDCAGCGSPERPADMAVLANAIAPEDVPEKLSQLGWRTIRGACWAGGMPPDGEHKRALFALLRAQDKTPEERLPAAWAYFRDHHEAILQGCTPTDPTRWTQGSTDRDAPAFNLLVQESIVGTRLFASHFQNLRMSSESALWPMGKATWLRRDGPHLRVMDKTSQPVGGPIPLHNAQASVWLDPRYSEDIARNDYAAASAVIKVRTPAGFLRVVVALETERADAETERGLYWRAVDAVAAMGITSIVGGYEKCGGLEKYIDPALAVDAAARRLLGKPAPIPTAYPSTQGKYSLDRLGRLAYPIESGAFCFLDTLRGCEGIRQAERLGSGGHDDGPDAMERADNALANEVDRDAFYASMFGR